MYAVYEAEAVFDWGCFAALDAAFFARVALLTSSGTGA
jgi:hypothetical protein